MDKSNLKNLPPEVEELVEQIGDLMKHWGFKKIHGKIWSMIFLSDKPLDAAEIIARLDVSKSLVSMSLADLIDMELVFPNGKSSEGTQLYVPNTDISAVILNILRYKERKVFAKLNSSYSLVDVLPEQEKKKYNLNDERLKQFGDFIKQAESLLSKLITPKTKAS